MTKQEEIREGITRLTHREPLTQKILRWMDSQGAMIKVKCPHCDWSQVEEGEHVGMTPCYSCNSMGFIMEPLIKE